MITAYLLRDYHPDHTRGIFVAKDDDGNIIHSCVVLELPWKDNLYQISCIPEGMYQVVRRYTTKFRWHYHILDVPNRTFILMHPGNHTRQILGCMLPGVEIKHLDSDQIPDITDTRLTLNKMLKAFGNEFRLHVGSFEPPKHPCKVLPSHYSTIPPATPLP